MPTIKSRPGFLDTIEGKEIQRKLQLMTDDASYNTESSYTANGTLYPDNLMPFVDKHITYLISHPLLNPNEYLANVRLLTRLR